MINKSPKTTREHLLSRFLRGNESTHTSLSPKRTGFDKVLITRVKNKKNQLHKIIPPKPAKKTSKIKSELISLKKSISSLPELKKRSSIKRRSLRSTAKYLLFVLEPHWQYFYSGSRSIGLWVKNSSLILWRSKRGKIILVQVGVIGVLAALLVWQIKPAMPLPKPTYAQTESADLVNENLGVRRYLPTAREYIPPTAFEPVSILAEKVPLSAWIAPWNIAEQQSSLRKYSSISAFWLTLNENGYDVDAKGNWEPWIQATQNLDPEQITKWLSISGDPDYVFKALTDTDLENKLIENLTSNVQKWSFDGIDIDFEGLGASNKDVFSIFIKHLAEKFHSIGKRVSVTVEVRLDDPPMDWPSLAQYADEIRPMFYDYHSRNTGYPGPVAPIGWISEKMTIIKKDIPMEKVVPALGNYGYDWQKSTDPLTTDQYHGIGLSFEKAVNLAVEKNQQISRAKGNDPRGYDIGDAPHFSYLDETNNEHHVWFEDKISLTAKANLIAQYLPKSIIFWNVGSLGDTLYWQAEDFNSATIESTTPAEAEKNLDATGTNDASLNTQETNTNENTDNADIPPEQTILPAPPRYPEVN